MGFYYILLSNICSFSVLGVGNMSHLEEFIKDFYTKIGIVSPQQLHFQEVAYKLGISVYYWPNPSQALFMKNIAYIFLNEHLNEQQKWQDFNHELAHVLLHAGNQNNITESFRKYQEHKANHFMYHACVPTFMLDTLNIQDYTYNTILMVQNLFNVEHDFATKRLEQYINNKFYYSKIE